MTVIPQISKVTDPGERQAACGPDKDGVLGAFFTRDIVNAKETEAQGRVVVEHIPYVKMLFPGDPLTRICERVTDEHRERWPNVWKAYEEKREGVVDGTPIEHLTTLTRGQVAALRYLGVATIEQLAAVGDNKISMDITRAMRDQAQQFLKGSGEVEQLRARIVELEQENAALKEQSSGRRRSRKANADDLERQIA